MTRVAINGAAGRMGQRLVALATADDDMEVVVAMDASGHPALGKDAGVLAGVGELGIAISEPGQMDKAKVDAIIDFSLPAGTMTILDVAVASGIPLVIGTTGLDDDQKASVAAASDKVAVLLGTNMSVGVNLLFKIVGQVAKALGDDYDIEVIEAHHRFKKDAPSGTAMTLAEKLVEATGRSIADDLVHGRSGIVGERTQKEIGMHAVRAGDIVGDHTVLYCNLGERIEIRHQAHTRDNFVRGALRAAKYMAGKPAGSYGMADVLGL
jgi:4-hydroxy-tetrahydrodipicolinate reductase